MNDEEDSHRCAQTKQDKSVLRLGVLGIGYESAILVGEDRLRFGERDPVLPAVRAVLSRIPFNPKLGNVTIIPTM